MSFNANYSSSRRANQFEFRRKLRANLSEAHLDNAQIEIARVTSVTNVYSRILASP